MSEWKQYSIINDWATDDSEQGSFAWSGAARSVEEADELAVEAMRQSYADHYGMTWDGEPGAQPLFVEGADVFRAAEAAEIISTIIDTYWKGDRGPVTMEELQGLLDILRPDIPKDT